MAVHVNSSPLEYNVAADEKTQRSQNEEHDQPAYTPVPDKRKRWKLLFFGSLLVLTGTLNSLVVKAMNKKKLEPCPGCEPRYFQAPLFQGFLVIMADEFLLAVYLIDRWINVKKKKKAKGVFDICKTDQSFLKPRLPFKKWILPGILHSITILLFHHAVVLTHLSVVQFARNFNILFGAFMRTLILRKAMRVHEWLGVTTMTVGLAATGIYGVVQPDTHSNLNPKLSWVGALLALFGTTNQCLMFTIEEKLASKYYFSPLMLVGGEGLIAMPVIIVGLIVSHQIGFENFFGTMYMISKNSTLLLLSISYLILIAGFATSGLSVSKLGSSVLRIVVMSFRTISLFILEIGLGWNGFTWLGFSSMAVLVVGGFTFHNIPKLTMTWYTQPMMCCMFLKLEAPSDRTASQTNRLAKIEAEEQLMSSSMRRSKNNHELDSPNYVVVEEGTKNEERTPQSG